MAGHLRRISLVTANICQNYSRGLSSNYIAKVTQSSARVSGCHFHSHTHRSFDLPADTPSYVQRMPFSSSQKPEARERKRVTINFIMADGEKVPVKAKVGDNLLDVVLDEDVDIDGFGACEGTLSCSTCHLVFKENNFDTIEEKATDEELDMLDLAYGLTDTSRLGCQVIVTEDMDGWEVRVPEGVADARS